MNAEEVRNYFSKDGVVCDYARAVLQVGLWESEKIVFEKYFAKDCKLLELGCGAGRIAHGLFARGFSKLTSSDFSPKMIEFAKEIASDCNDEIDYQVQDATSLTFQNEIFEGAIFGFNGLMQIPTRKNRRLAMSEIYRVLKPNSYFIFTTHDRSNPQNQKYWADEKSRWQGGSQHSKLDEFGDICYESEYGELFIHSPLPEEIEEDIEAVGFKKIESKKRSQISYEPKNVQDFSDDCIFWICQKST